MNKFFKIILTAMVVTSVLLSCRDDDKDLFTRFDDPNGAVVVWTEISSPLINADDILNSAYVATLDDPAEPNRVASYSAFVVYKGDTAAFQTITSFPATITLSVSSMAQALTAAGFPTQATDFAAGDRIDVFANITDVRGITYGPANYQNNLLNGPGQRAMVRFNFFIACAYTAQNIAGTYTVVNDQFGLYAANGTGTVQVVADGNNAIIIQGLYSNRFIGLPGHQNFNVRVSNINSATGSATVVAQQAWDTGFLAPPNNGFGVVSVDGSGFVLACTETVILNLQHRVAAGTFTGGPFNITLEKNP